MRVMFMESHPMLVNGLPNGFQDAGCEIKISGPLSETNIPKLISQFHPDLILTMGWSNEMTDKKATLLRKCVKKANIPLVYWATEDPTHTHSFTLPLIQKLQPDFVFTICSSRVDYYKMLGIKAAHMDFGYHPKVHFKTEPDEKYRCEIAVVANGYPRILNKYPQHYRIQSLKTLISPLIKTGMRVDFWGKDWDKTESILGCQIPPEWIHGYIKYLHANRVYSSADIVLGVQNQLTQLSQRTYEIMASGGFLLTSDTPEIRRLFNPNDDLIVSSSPEQTVMLAKHYLKNADERRKISLSGQKAVLVHNYTNRALDMLQALKDEKII